MIKITNIKHQDSGQKLIPVEEQELANKVLDLIHEFDYESDVLTDRSRERYKHLF